MAISVAEKPPSGPTATYTGVSTGDERTVAMNWPSDWPSDWFAEWLAVAELLVVAEWLAVAEGLVVGEWLVVGDAAGSGGVTSVDSSGQNAGG